MTGVYFCDKVVGELNKLKIGDLVEPYDKFMVDNTYYGVGVILDRYETEDGIIYFEVQWAHARQWLGQDEMRVVSESGR